MSEIDSMHITKFQVTFKIDDIINTIFCKLIGTKEYENPSFEIIKQFCFHVIDKIKIEGRTNNNQEQSSTSEKIKQDIERAAKAAKK